MVTESEMTIDGKTHIFVEETNESGYELCFGCKQPFGTRSVYSFSERENETTFKHYNVHKYCYIPRGEGGNNPT